VGTGSGAIAISLAAARPALVVLATDVSPAALAVARANARRLLGARQRRVRFLEGSLLEPVDEQVDIIAANLPYVPSAEMPALPVSVRGFEPAQALDGGRDGLDGYRALLHQAAAKLKPGGALLMECDPRQAPALAALAAAAFPQAHVAVQRDLAGRDRVLEVVAYNNATVESTAPPASFFGLRTSDSV
jgi:release factor glutamine methyltransferase